MKGWRLKVLRALTKTVKFIFIVFCFFLLSLCFIDWSLPGSVVSPLIARQLPPRLVLNVDRLCFGFRNGVTVENLRLYDRERRDATTPLVSVEKLSVDPLSRRVMVVAPKYARLHDGYYEPGNLERNARVEATFPSIPRFHLQVEQTDILGVVADRLYADVEVTPSRASFDNILLVWPDADRHMTLEGFCTIDLGRQQVLGEVKGLTTQRHIRPLLVALDVPVSLPYFDGFTEVTEPVPACCRWDVNLVNSDFDLDLDIKPTLGAYNTVKMRSADGHIHLHPYTRGTSLNYVTTVKLNSAIDANERPLSGTVTITGTNGYNTVDIDAKSAMPAADILKIGGFEDEYLDRDIIGDLTGKLQFRFPRAMTNNYEVLNGAGHIRVENGQVMRMKGFAGLIELLADKVPGVSYITDRTNASCDYVIENGVVKTDNIYIEGGLFSIKMYGQFDAVKDALDFRVRVQFLKNDSLMGKLLHPVTWVFTKLLLEFRLTGGAHAPQWEYVSVVDRVMEVVK